MHTESGVTQPAGKILFHYAEVLQHSRETTALVCSRAGVISYRCPSKPDLSHTNSPEVKP